MSLAVAEVDERAGGISFCVNLVIYCLYAVFKGHGFCRIIDKYINSNSPSRYFFFTLSKLQPRLDRIYITFNNGNL